MTRPYRLLALAPAVAILGAPWFANRIAPRILRPKREGQPADSATSARLLVPVLAAIALVFTFRGGSTLVTLLLMAYSMVIVGRRSRPRGTHRSV